MYGTLFMTSILCQPLPPRHTCAQRYCEGKVAAKGWKQSRHVGYCVPASPIYLIHHRRTLYESKGLEFNDVGLTFLRVYFMTDKI